MKKKLFFGSLLVLALTMAGCQKPAESNVQSSDGQPTSQPSGESQQSQPSGGTSQQSDIPAPAAGAFAFDDAQLNTVQEIHTANQLKYLSLNKEYYSMGKSDLDGCDAMGNKNVSTPLPVKVSWNFTPETGKTVSKYAFIFGQKSDLSDGYELSTTSKSLDIYNSFLGTNYFKVVAKYSDNSEKASDIKTFKVTENAPRNLNVGNLPNFRDMGGRTTYAGGKVKQGLIYRGAGNNFDMRGTAPDADAKEVLLNQLRVKTEINVANSTGNNLNLSGVKVENAYMAYGAVPYSNLARNSVRIRQIMDILADETKYPVFYHCRIGTDRTGITGVMIGGLLGIKFNEIIQDYGFSNFAPIDNQRYPGKTPDDNGDDIKKYIDEIIALPGETFQEKTYLALRMLGVPAAKLDTIINLNTEGAKASIPEYFKVGEGSGLTSSATIKNATDYKTPASYYGVSANGTVSYKATLTGGNKDVIAYLGYTGSVSTSTSTKLASSLTLKIDGVEQTISNTKSLWQAGFGSTQQDSRIGYMFNILGSYDFTAGEHTVELTVKSGTFNIASITIADRGPATGEGGQGGQGGDTPASSPLKVWDAAATKAGLSNASAKEVKDTTGDVQFTVYKLGTKNDYVEFKYTATEAKKVVFNYTFTTKAGNATKTFFWHQDADLTTAIKHNVYVNGTKIDAPADSNPSFQDFAGGADKVIESDVADSGALANPITVALFEFDLVANQENVIKIEYVGSGYSTYVAGANLTVK